MDERRWPVVEPQRATRPAAPGRIRSSERRVCQRRRDRRRGLGSGNERYRSPGVALSRRPPVERRRHRPACGARHLHVHDGLPRRPDHGARLDSAGRLRVDKHRRFQPRPRLLVRRRHHGVDSGTRPARSAAGFPFPATDLARTGTSELATTAPTGGAASLVSTQATGLGTSGLWRSANAGAGWDRLDTPGSPWLGAGPPEFQDVAWFGPTPVVAGVVDGRLAVWTGTPGD